MGRESARAEKLMAMLDFISPLGVDYIETLGELMSG